jgi:hypothetical protein
MALAQTVREVVGDRDIPEGRFSRAVEHQAARVPTGLYYNLAFTSIVGSLALAAYSRRHEWATFVGLWAPTFMLLGLHRKLTREHEHRS